MQKGGQCEQLWEKPAFTSKILYMVFDEAHCISQWSEFRKDYSFLGNLRYLIPETIPFYLPTATCAERTLRETSETMHLRAGRTEYILYSNDRPELSISVHRMQHSAISFKDIGFIIPDNFQEGDPLPPFLVFTESIKEAEAAAHYLNSRLPLALRNRVRYFHSVMTPQYRIDECEAFRRGETYGLCVTDSFGMVRSVRASQWIKGLTNGACRGSTFPESSLLCNGKCRRPPTHYGNASGELRGGLDSTRL